MSSRIQALLLALVFVLFDSALFFGLHWLLGSVGEEDATTADVLRENWHWALLICVFVIALFVVEVVVVVRVHLRDLSEFEARAESDFERRVVNELSFQQPPAPEPAPSPLEGQPPPTPAPAPQVSADITALLSQLRLAGLDPVVEGKVQRGELEGSALLRLANDDVGIALMRPPTSDDWPRIFPRYDRAYVPLDGNHWIALERMENVVRRAEGGTC